MIPNETHTTSCPICGGENHKTLFHLHKKYPVLHCSRCKTQYLSPQPDDDTLAEIYQANYFLGGDTPESQQKRHQMKQKTAQIALDELATYRKSEGGTLLEIGCGQGELLVEAESRGYHVTGIEYSSHAAEVAQGRLTQGTVIVGDLHTANLPSQHFDVIVHADLIEHVRDPKAFMQEVKRLLKPGGVLQTTTISLNTLTYRLMRRYWMEFKVEHLFYFSDNALFILLYHAGFKHVERQPTYKVLTPTYIKDHFVKYPIPLVTPIVRLFHAMLPRHIQRHEYKFTGSGITITGTLDTLTHHTLSVIVPTYNEARTFTQMMEQLLAVDIGDVNKEIIIVESHSTDGTRELVEGYKEHPNVTVVLQDKAHGKGAAVREGLQRATGNFVIIQDADLEYDITDYPRLIQPLIDGRAAFVLGTRHVAGDTRDIRRFEKDQKTAAFMNFGHNIFRSLLNILYGQSMSDPFTMYKVFFRDALHNVSLESNRFDFDFELVIKLIRKGFVPLEIPVHYVSRSFDEGKKVRIFADPLTWIVALIKFRFAPLHKPKTK